MKKISVIFDTGSNYFGATSGIYKDMKDSPCGSFIHLTIPAYNRNDPNPLDSPFNIRFPFKEQLLSDRSNANECVDTYIEKLDQTNFGEIKDDHIIIIGTMGLRGKTITAYPMDVSAPKRGEFFLSIEDN
jgi:hypothetical protein